MPEIDKEALEFMTRLGGGVVSAIEDAAFIWWQDTHPEVAGTFPFTRPHPSAPTWYELIVGGLAIPPFVGGLLAEEDAKKKGDTKTRELAKSVREFGEGSIFFAAPWLMKQTACQVTPRAAGARPQTSAAQKQRQTGGIVYKL